jgi:hypothetical protein
MVFEFKHFNAYAATLSFRCPLFLYDGRARSEPLPDGLVVPETNAGVNSRVDMCYRYLV